MATLSDIVRDPDRILHGTMAFTAGGLEIATTTYEARTANTITYIVDGKFCSKGATDNLFILPASQNLISVGGGSIPVATSTAFSGDTRYYFCGLNAAGTAYVYASIPQDSVEIANSIAADDTLVPAIDAGVCIVGIIKVVATSAATFTPGTTALTGVSGVTVTYSDVAMIPVSLP